MMSDKDIFPRLADPDTDVDRLREKLKEHGGGGNGGDMEARVAKLEASVEHMAADVSQLKSDTRDLRDRMTAVEVKIDHLPSKGFIVTVVILALAVIAGFIGYADQLQAFRPDQ